jgi:predicted outer membrane repeat protein
MRRSVMSKIIKWFSVVFLVGASLACTREVHESGKALIKLPEKSVVYNSSHKAADPTGLSEIECFAVFVSVPELNLNYCEGTNAALEMKNFSYHDFYGTFSSGSIIELEVPTGPEREFAVIGFAKDYGTICSDLKFQDTDNLSSPFLIGSSGLVDLLGGSQEVGITVDLNVATTYKMGDCYGPNTPTGGDGNNGGTPVVDTPTANFSYNTLGDMFYFKDSPITSLLPSISGLSNPTFTVSPALPTGLALNSTTGEISGTPTVAASAIDYTFIVTDSDGTSYSDTRHFGVAIQFIVNVNTDTGDLASNGICDDGSGNCTLRAAINEAQTTTNDVHIMVGNQNIYLDSQLIMTKASGDLHIVGSGYNNSILDGQNSTQILSIQGSGSGLVVLTQLSLINAEAYSSPGGAVNVAGTYSGQLKVDQSKFSGNNASAGAAINFPSINGSLEVSESEFSLNTTSAGGGAIHTYTKTINITKTLFNSNSASADGGALYIAQQTTSNSLDITNSTFYNNSIGLYQKGAAIYISGAGTDYDANVINNTFASNSDSVGTSGDIHKDNSAMNIFVANNIFESTGSVPYDCVSDGGGAITSLGGNVTMSSGSNCSSDPNDIEYSGTSLGSYMDNGGLFWSLAIYGSGAPAVDVGISTYCALFDGDQRGSAYPRISGTSCDAGAIEF